MEYRRWISTNPKKFPSISLFFAAEHGSRGQWISGYPISYSSVAVWNDNEDDIWTIYILRKIYYVRDVGSTPDRFPDWLTKMSRMSRLANIKLGKTKGFSVDACANLIFVGRRSIMNHPSYKPDGNVMTNSYNALGQSCINFTSTRSNTWLYIINTSIESS